MVIAGRAGPSSRSSSALVSKGCRSSLCKIDVQTQSMPSGSAERMAPSGKPPARPATTSPIFTSFPRSARGMSTCSPVDSTVTVRPSTVLVKATVPRPEADISHRKVRGRRHCGGIRSKLPGKASRAPARVSSNMSQLRIQTP